MASINASTLQAVQEILFEELGEITDLPIEALGAGAQVIFYYSQQLCPVDTGYLKSTGYIRVNGNDVEVGYEADYASYVEFGTYKMAAQPYLRPAIDEHQAEIVHEVAAVVQDYIAEITGQRPVGGSNRSIYLNNP